jgi:hypothetical protein
MTHRKTGRVGYRASAMLLLTGVSLLACCSGDQPRASPSVLDAGIPADVTGEGLTDAEEALADRTPSFPFTLDQVLLPNGQTVAAYVAARGITVQDLPVATDATQRLDDVIAGMIAYGYYLTNRDNWQLPATSNAPAQNGLAYSFGEKDPNRRERPPVGTCSTVTQGLDCSGTLYQCANAVGIALPPGSAMDQTSVFTWNAAIPPSYGIEAEVEDGTDPQVGDIISWGNHIGFIGAVGPTFFVIQSNGTSGGPTCPQNLSQNRGPRAVPLQQILAWDFPNPPTYLRLVVSPTDAGPDASHEAMQDADNDGPPACAAAVIAQGGCHTVSDCLCGAPADRQGLCACCFYPFNQNLECQFAAVDAAAGCAAMNAQEVEESQRYGGPGGPFCTTIP